MGVGTKVKPGEVIKASKMNLKLETVATEDIPDEAVTTPKIASAPNGVDTAKINNLAVTTPKIADSPNGISSAKINEGAVTTAKILNRAVTRAKIEYPKVDVNFVLLALLNKIKGGWLHYTSSFVALTTDTFTDKASETWGDDEGGGSVARWVDKENWYRAVLSSGLSSKDFAIEKCVNGGFSTLGYEAVDIRSYSKHQIKLSCEGTTLKAYREDMTSPKISVTDSAHSEGKYGYLDYTNYGTSSSALTTFLRAAGSPSPKVLRYYEVPVIGSGTMKDPFRAKMPLVTRKHKVFGDTNPLALSHSAVIKIGKDGKPVDYRAIVRVFEQPKRQKHLYSVTKSLDALKTQTGVTKLTKAEAIREAKKLDDKLTDKNLKVW